MGLTKKQEQFCQVFVETGNASEAYRQSYSAGKTKAAVVNVKASELLKNGKVAVRVKELQAVHAERHNVTVDDLLAELEQARTVALTAMPTPQSSAAVAATMGKARILGMDKQVVEHNLTLGVGAGLDRAEKLLNGQR